MGQVVVTRREWWNLDCQSGGWAWKLLGAKLGKLWLGKNNFGLVPFLSPSHRLDWTRAYVTIPPNQNVSNQLSTAAVSITLQSLHPSPGLCPRLGLAFSSKTTLSDTHSIPDPTPNNQRSSPTLHSAIHPFLWFYLDERSRAPFEPSDERNPLSFSCHPLGCLPRGLGSFCLLEKRA